MYKKEQTHIEFSDLYVEYYPKLLRFAREYLIREEDAENAVQDVFVRLWDRRDYLEEMVNNINAYLFRLTRNRCLDHLKNKLNFDRNSVSVTDMELSFKMQALERFDDEAFVEEDIERLMQEAIDSLPEKCREIFVLSRIEGLKYKQISERLDVSINTVESQMSIALKKLRVKLKNYLPLFIFIIS